MSKNFIKYFVIVLPPILAAFLIYGTLQSLIIAPFNKNSTKQINIEVAQGKSLTQIAEILQSNGLIKSILGFKILARLTSGSSTIKAGEYALSPSMTPKEILHKMIIGDIVKRTVLVLEGGTIWDIAKTVSEVGLISESEFLRTANNPEYLKKAGITGPSFEGYLFPAKYDFSKPISDKEIIWRMLEEGEQRWNEEFSNQLDLLGMTRHELLTLASMIQREGKNTAEFPLISSVFHNRLKQGMKLQCDSTVIYGIPHFNGNLTKADLETDTLYNTYTRLGLPIGPIGNPGEDAIRAALFPRATNYLYFVADGKGNHVFSENLKDHNQAVQDYLASIKQDK